MNRKEGIELRGRWGVGDAGVRGGSSSVASIRGRSQVVQIWPDRHIQSNLPAIRTPESTG
jgi:hypothetical protein